MEVPYVGCGSSVVVGRESVVWMYSILFVPLQTPGTFRGTSDAQAHACLPGALAGLACRGGRVGGEVNDATIDMLSRSQGNEIMDRICALYRYF